MDVDCEGCAGCCVDWRELSFDASTPERTGEREPIDGAHNFVPLECEEVRDLLADGLGDVLTPRLWTLPTEPADSESVDDDGGEAELQHGDGAEHRDRSETEQRDDEAAESPHDEAAESPHSEAAESRHGEATATASNRTVAIDGYDLAAVEGRPVFYVGLRKPPKPVAPFDREEAAWLPTCVFLDPETLQCRVHGDDHYPEGCAAYPGYNLQLEQETECERVEAAHGGERLVDDEPPRNLPGVGVGPQSLGAKLFAHPEPEALDGRIERIARGEPTDEDRATFAAVAAASSPGTLTVAPERREEAFERALAADSWAGRAIEEWRRLAASDDESADAGAEARAGQRAAVDPAVAERVEECRGAPPTPGWE